MTDKEKIAHYLQLKGIPKNQFYKRTGFSNKFLDSGSSLGADKLRIIIQEFSDFNLDWFFHGKGEPVLSSKKYQENTAQHYLIQENAEGVPIVPNVAVLSLSVLPDLPAHVDDVEYFKHLPHFYFPLLPSKSEPYLCVEVEGNTMHPTLLHKDWLVGERVVQLSSLKKNEVYIIVTRDTVEIGRVKETKAGDSVTFQPDNSEYDEFEVKLEVVLAIYRAKHKFSSNFHDLHTEEKMADQMDKIKSDINSLKKKKK